jgi:hypothetical protein
LCVVKLSFCFISTLFNLGSDCFERVFGSYGRCGKRPTISSEGSERKIIMDKNNPYQDDRHIVMSHIAWGWICACIYIYIYIYIYNVEFFLVILIVFQLMCMSCYQIKD